MELKLMQTNLGKTFALLNAELERGFSLAHPSDEGELMKSARAFIEALGKCLPEWCPQGNAIGFDELDRIAREIPNLDEWRTFRPELPNARQRFENARNAATTLDSKIVEMLNFDERSRRQPLEEWHKKLCVAVQARKFYFG